MAHNSMQINQQTQFHHAKNNSLTNGPVSKFSTPNKLSGGGDQTKIRKLNSGIINEEEVLRINNNNSSTAHFQNLSSYLQDAHNNQLGHNVNHSQTSLRNQAKKLRSSKSSSQINHSKNSSLYNLQYYKPANQEQDPHKRVTPDIADMSDDEEYKQI